jgi:transcriptional regulator with XRE-family HTH domain
MFTECLKSYRIKNGLSQERLAEIAGISTRTIQRLESGDTEPRGDTVIRLSKALEISPNDLLQYKKREDLGYHKALSISQFSFLLFPIFGILIPFIFWITKKGTIENLDHHGKEIINFQITWNLILFLGLFTYWLWYLTSISSISEVSISITNKYMLTFCITFGAIYFYNLLISSINLIFTWKIQPLWYKPTFRFIK